MSIITKEFIYTGGVHIAEVPHGTTTLTLHLWGGAGGGGGDDVATGGTGSAGHYVTKTDLDMTSYAGVKNITVTVGGGGGGGSTGAQADGGTNGKSITDYSGGTGGVSGPNNPSGSGGGGGGATVVTIFADGETLTNTIVAIAGGGAGGGGGGAMSNGAAGSNTNSATTRTPGTLGENGAHHSAAGAGAGAGGGGADGGKGGSSDTGDIGAFGGRAGSNTVPSSGSEDNGSGITPGGTGVSYYDSEVAVAGANAQSGGDGKAVLIFTIPAEAHYKVSGAWKKITGIHTKVSGAWQRLVAGYVKIAGSPSIWKALFANDVSFSVNYAGFGNSSGGTTSGSVGVAGDLPAIAAVSNPPAGGGEGRPPPPPVCQKQYWGPVSIPGAKNGYQCTTNEKGGSNPRVICTWLQNRDLLDYKDYILDTQFTAQHLSYKTQCGYWLWAIPLANWMSTHELSTDWWSKFGIKITMVFAKARAKEISYIMGGRDKGSIFGKLIRLIGEPLCWLLGHLVNDKKLNQLNIAKEEVNGN
jgi:hypothetical protein